MSVSVLLVEDQADIREQVRELLASAGYEVHCAESPEEALVHLHRLPRPCILLWDALTPRQSLTMVDQATLEGVHVAALPVSVLSTDLSSSTRRITKQLVSKDAILAILREHCPLLLKSTA
jgi:two-component system response regulator CpxR